MSWNRRRLGNVRDGGLVHILYEWFKDGRVHWDTQCRILWADRDNTDRSLKPPVSRKPVTCVECVAQQLKIGISW